MVLFLRQHIVDVADVKLLGIPLQGSEMIKRTWRHNLAATLFPISIQKSVTQKSGECFISLELQQIYCKYHSVLSVQWHFSTPPNLPFYSS
jgi:hypothetical protein